MRQGDETASSDLLVYRGGFLRFLQPKNAPGTVGKLEFRDGKGRIRNKHGGYQKEFEQDGTDLGEILHEWHAKSGKTVQQGASTDYREAKKWDTLHPAGGRSPRTRWMTVKNK